VLLQPVYSDKKDSPNYSWSQATPSGELKMTITNPTGSGFTANYASTGVKTLTVSSGSASAACIVNVLAGGTVPPVTPSLPNTGGGYGQQ
jgi:O-acetylhomoserine/O-acetylserine sulfhydrylase-like pyridoxal-dependent enzyme